MIRPATAQDAAAVAAVYAPYVLGSVATFEVVPPTEAEVAARMATGLPWLVADVDGVVGYAYAGPHHARAGYRWSVTVSVYLDAAHHGRGLGRALYGELLPLLTTNSEGLLEAAGQMIRTHVSTYDVPLDPHRIEVLIDMVVRLVLSHVMQPGGDPARTAEHLAWIVARVLGREPV